MQDVVTNSQVVGESGRSIQSNLAMTVALISWGMLFATLFMIYAVARASAIAWPPMGLEKVSLTIPTLSTLSIALSSFFLFDAEKKFIGNRKAFLFYILSVLSGALFLGLQFVFWKSLAAVGIYSGTGIFGSLIYAFTWIHAAHIFLGLLGLIWVYPVFKKGQGSELKVRNIAKFWHFLGLIWLIMYLSIFVY